MRIKPVVVDDDNGLDVVWDWTREEPAVITPQQPSFGWSVCVSFPSHLTKNSRNSSVRCLETTEIPRESRWSWLFCTPRIPMWLKRCVFPCLDVHGPSQRSMLGYVLSDLDIKSNERKSVAVFPLYHLKWQEFFFSSLQAKERLLLAAELKRDKRVWTILLAFLYWFHMRARYALQPLHESKTLSRCLRLSLSLHFHVGSFLGGFKSGIDYFLTTFT